MINPPGRQHYDLKCVWTKQDSYKIHEAKTVRAERRNRYKSTIIVKDFNNPSQQLLELLEKK